MCADVSAEHTFRIKAQIHAYRRLIRGLYVPSLVTFASAPRYGPQLPIYDHSPAAALLVRRGVHDLPFEPCLVLARTQGDTLFDLRAMPRLAVSHVFGRDDVVGKGEEHVSDLEVEERLHLADVHHRRLYANFLTQKGGSKSSSHRALELAVAPRLDPFIAQRRARVIHAIHPNEGEVEEKCNEQPRVRHKHVAERKSARRRDRTSTLITKSLMRDRAAVPISVLSRPSCNPSYQHLLQERQMRVERRIKARLEDIQDMKPCAPEQVRQQLAIEEKSIKLCHLQRSVRTKIMACIRGVLDRRGVSDLRPEKIFKLRRRYAYNNKSYNQTSYVNTPPRMEMSYRVQQEAQRRARRANVMQGLLNHAQQFRGFLHSSLALRKRLLKDLDRYFRDRSREEERRKKKEQMDRLRALRNNNEDEYLELLKTTKNKRLIQLLKQTDEYLMQIGAQVERQKQTVRAEDDGSDGKVEDANGESKLEDGEVEQASASGEETGDDLNQLKRRRNDYYTITHTISEKVFQPTCLVGGKLKNYQVEGLEWLVSLYNNNLNGILADEMGLGKTIQTLSLITYLCEVKKMFGPFLVIVPLSVISNWVRELDLWAPSITKVVYKGDPATRKNIQLYEMQGGNYNVLLTTYEFIVKDKNVLGRIRWKYIIMDEGHRMKNADCKLALTLGAKYSSRNRLLLTGTPLQNNMTELWALLNFLLPSIFSSAETFETWFNAPFQASVLGDSAELNEEENLLIISRLHQVLRPFMLRRLKTDVETQLPDKVEIVFRCEMSIWQRVLYRQMRAKLGIASGTGVSTRCFNNTMMQLKKVCNHPYLFYNEEELMSVPPEFLMRAAGKFELLDHCLRKLKKAGHRVLMFSQMTAALDYLEYFLTTIGMTHLRLDGTTKADDRQEMLEIFNAENSEYFCFLLSTRAGGLGLNLQTADTVIIFDSDWNPMMDLQAQDRAHRIGQTKEVRVFRLICSGSIEVKILERANRKLQIDAQVIQAGQFNNKSSDNDRHEMLKDLLRQQTGDDPTDMMEDVTAPVEINRQLARSEEEFEMFQEMDVQLALERNGKPRLLVDEAELPPWVLKPEKEHKDKKQTEAEKILEHGRGRRKRKEVVYDDNLTDREWTAAMEDKGDIVEAVKRKRRRLSSHKGAILESSSSAEQGEQQGYSARESSDKEAVVSDMIKESVGSTPEIESTGEGQKSEEQEVAFVSKLKPFVDPELNKEPRVRRKRGRPRKYSRR